MEPPAVSVVIPTRNRADYLEVALASLARQQLDDPHEVLVVDDASSDRTAEVAATAGARWIRNETPEGLNAARNTGVRMSGAPLIAFLDDDVDAPPGWRGGRGGTPGPPPWGGPPGRAWRDPPPRPAGARPRRSPPSISDPTTPRW